MPVGMGFLFSYLSGFYETSFFAKQKT